jgi:5-methylcytosine-specific restriction enzyme subunit McrC
VTSASRWAEHRHISVAEHDAVPVSDVQPGAISTAEAELLLTLNDTYPRFCERRYRSIRFSQYCGVVNMAGRALEIVPKIGEHSDAAEGRGVLLRLLRMSGLTHAVPQLPAAQQLRQQPLLEIFIALFLDSVRTVVRGGLLALYVERERDLSVVRGRIAFSRQFGVNFNRPDIIASQYDEHTADNQWNRPIKAAMRIVRPWIIGGVLQRRWVELIGALDDVSDVHITLTDVDQLIIHRQAVRYGPAIGWVRWILQLLSPGLRVGEARAPSFLFDMNILFEKAVTRALRQQLAASHPHLNVREQVGGRYLARTRGPLSRRVFGLRPDIVVTDGSSVVLVADAKWKSPEVTRAGAIRPSRADMYQMHAYATTFKVPRLALIYPSAADTPAAATFDLTSLAPASAIHVTFADLRDDTLRVQLGVPQLLAERRVPSSASETVGE